MDFLAIGDATIDAFIRLADAKIECDHEGAHCQLCVRYGDKVPYEFVEVVAGVGNSANAAVAAARLGLKSGVRVHIGDDANGRDCMQAWEQNGVDTSLVVREPGKTTNYHYVLWYEIDRTILIKHEHFNYTFPDLSAAPKWIYLSSLGEGTEAYHAQIAAYLAAHPETRCAFQPGTYQIKLGTDALRDIYQRSEIFVCNKEEAQIILKTESHDLKELLEGIRALGPKIVVITDGREGSYARQVEGRMWHVPMYPDPKPPLERTGAGDATASTTVAYLIHGMSLEESLLRGQINSMSVVQAVGAQKGLLTAEQIEAWYAKRPPEYRATEL